MDLSIKATMTSVARLPLFLIALVAPVFADDWTRYLGFKKADPQIRSVESYLTVPIYLEEERICIFPFATNQGGAPPAPDFVPAFVEAVNYHLPKTELVTLKRRPAANVTIQQTGEFDVPGAMNALASERSCTLFVNGLIERAYRKPSGGCFLEVIASLYAVGVEAPALRWRARKRIDWRGRFPLKECLLLYAEEVVFDWDDFGPEPANPPPAKERQSDRRRPTERSTQKVPLPKR